MMQQCMHALCPEQAEAEVEDDDDDLLAAAAASMDAEARNPKLPAAASSKKKFGGRTAAAARWRIPGPKGAPCSATHLYLLDVHCEHAAEPLPPADEARCCCEQHDLVQHVQHNTACEPGGWWVQASGLGRWVRKSSTEGGLTPPTLTPRPREGSRLANPDAGMAMLAPVEQSQHKTHLPCWVPAGLPFSVVHALCSARGCC